MTQPTNEQHAPPSSAQQQAQVTAALATVLLAGLSATALGSYVAGLLAPLRIGGQSARLATKLATAGTPLAIPDANVTGPAERTARAGEAAYRAAFLLATARRIDERLAEGKTPEQAVAAERGYYAQHRAAQTNRARTAATVDTAARAHGPLLGWKAVMDSRTSAECRAADGHNFRADTMPAIGWPGAVHPHCRCRPVAPHARAGTVDQAVTALRTTTRKAA